MITATFSNSDILNLKRGVISKNQLESILTIRTIKDHLDLDDDQKKDLIHIMNDDNIDPFEKRIRAMLGLDKKKDFSSKIALLFKNGDIKNMPKIKYTKEIMSIFRDHYIESDILKRKFGEVLTPMDLVDDMLDILNNDKLKNIHKDFFNNPFNKDGGIKKILDTSNGTGPFLWSVIYRFMIGLENYNESNGILSVNSFILSPETGIKFYNLKNNDDRYSFIIENIIHACEIQHMKLFQWLCTIDLYDDNTTNIYPDSFLDKGFLDCMKDVWEVDKFDLIIGNPPYDEPQIASGKRGGGDTLWDKFVIRSIEILKPSGYLIFVHPPLWRKPQSEKSSSRKVSEIMMNKQIHYLEIHNTKDGLKTFNAGTRYDFYLLENCDIYTETLIKDEDGFEGIVDLRCYNFISNKIEGINTLKNLIADDDDEKCPILFNVSNYETRKTWVSDEKNEEYRYTLIHSTPKAGIRYKYSSKNDRGHFGIPKVIFGDSGINDVIIDIEGEIGMTQHAMAIRVNTIEEANNIKISLTSKKFTKFLESVMWSNFQIDWRLFTYLKRDFWKEFI